MRLGLLRTLLMGMILVSTVTGGSSEGVADTLPELTAREKELLAHARSQQVRMMERGRECIGDSKLLSEEQRNYCFSPREADFEPSISSFSRPLDVKLRAVLTKLVSAKPISIFDRLATCTYQPGWKVRVSKKEPATDRPSFKLKSEGEDTEVATILFCFNCDLAALLEVPPPSAENSGSPSLGQFREPRIKYFDIRPFRDEARAALSMNQ